MPPIHPALVHFPIALVIVSIVADLLSVLFKSASLRSTASWSLVGAAVTAAAAIAAGYYDMSRANLSEEVDGYVHLHLRIGWVILAALVILSGWRLFIKGGFSGLQSATYGCLALLLAAIVVFQAWYGGEMVYVHGASVTAAGQGIEQSSQGKERLHAIYEFFGAPHGDEHHHGTHGAAEVDSHGHTAK
jgi:uncharacterized membrane protein